ncbi:glycosyltransferase [Flavobacterium piscis]|uniref:Glycosyltransferase involved in cell wall biosynthesis n=1 Tax=Flavobacterium piscis TaxID=1114874 RepID=A0ABU1Y3X7_9FLAO|nr:glycosyltransferase [Flavobacterium piscis]MDR7208940.1 glycosyltransferase involved in cell wall biosynthesis [Flavobacterium piscis]
MKLLIVSTAPLIYSDNSVYAYSPYVNELIVLAKFNHEIYFACPVWETDRGLLISKLPFHFIKHFKVIDSNLNSFKNIFKAIFQSIYNFVVLFKAMKKADHIHLRCPGNIALIGCVTQIFFPNKTKTAKYAGNWDPNAQQPWTYKLQKSILNNAFLTRNMQVLVYGEWENQSKNVRPFFTASYSESEKEIIPKTNFNSGIRFIFVGSLVIGKNPMYAVKLIQDLIQEANKVTLDIYGEGPERESLENYIRKNQLENHISLHGNQNKETLKKAYQKSHFVILPSKSEGWPKAIAEGMFFGCVPVSTQVSCVPFMLDFGNRGVLLKMDLEADTSQITAVLKNKVDFELKSILAGEWSRKYTTDVFETEIKKLLKR